MIETVEVPTSTTDVVAALTAAATPGAAKVLAGGTLLMAGVNNQATDIRTLVSTRRIDNGRVALDGESVRIGAGATLTSLEANDELAFLRPALIAIASPTIRNMATIGGNLFAPSPYGDLAACLIALDAQVDIEGANGNRTESVEHVVAEGVGVDELVTDIGFERPAAGGWFFTKAMRRKLNSASIVTVAANLSIADGTITGATVALGGCGPTARRSPAAEAALIGGRLDEATVAAAGQAAISDAEFATDEYASAWYRERVLPVHFSRALLGETTSTGTSANNQPEGDA